MASVNVDQELRKAFQELQAKMVMTEQQLKVSDMQVDSINRQKTHANLVEKEISSLPKETRTYEGVGRMFVLHDVDTIKNNLDEKRKLCDEKIKKLQSNKTYLEKSLKESEANLREFVLSKQKERS